MIPRGIVLNRFGEDLDFYEHAGNKNRLHCSLKLVMSKAKSISGRYLFSNKEESKVPHKSFSQNVPLGISKVVPAIAELARRLPVFRLPLRAPRLIMIKHLKLVVACLSLGISLLFALTVTAGQTKISLERARNKKTGQTESTTSKASNPAQTNDPNAPALVSPDVQIGTSVTDSPQAANQNATQSVAEAPLPAPPCNISLLTVNEVFPAVLVNSGVPCLGCTIPNQLSQNPSGILGFSKFPNGPWTDTLSLTAQIDFSGNGESEPFYIKGLTVGTTLMHMHSPWADNFFEFHVENCACPTIPIVP